jgi:hypothetical protein
MHKNRFCNLPVKTQFYFEFAWMRTPWNEVILTSILTGKEVV